jgi:hydrogenase nickel incorporation protein HypB
MCESCGCDEPGAVGQRHHHDHDHVGHESAGHGHRDVSLGTDLLARNRAFAEKNRVFFRSKGILAVNVLGSPGAGKTTLLGATLDRLPPELKAAVITGDQAGDEDRRRLMRDGVPIIQIETGRVCHLDAHMIGHAIEDLPLEGVRILFIENVGNLVCPALFDLGETRRAVVLSVAEGDDKPSKYPEMFASADVVVFSKSDLAPHLDFDRERAERDVRRIRFTSDLLSLSARSGDGLDGWIAWLVKQAPAP